MSEQGITDFMGKHKIWKNVTSGIIYCPFCGRDSIYTYSNVEDLEKHLDSVVNGQFECQGHYLYGHYGIESVRNEIKYYYLKRKVELRGLKDYPKEEKGDE